MGEVRGEVGDVAARLAAAARDEGARMIVLGARSPGCSRTFLRASSAAELSELTDVPVLIAPLQLAADPTLARLPEQRWRTPPPVVARRRMNRVSARHNEYGTDGARAPQEEER